MQSITKCVIKLPTHHCHITVNQDGIHVFKYNDRTCDFMVFDHDHQYDASDYITEVLPTVYYSVIVNE